MGGNAGFNAGFKAGIAVFLVVIVAAVAMLIGVDYVLVQVLLTGFANLGTIFSVPMTAFLIMVEAISFILLIRNIPISEIAYKGFGEKLGWLVAIAILIMMMGYIDNLAISDYFGISIPVAAPGYVMNTSIGMGIALYNGALVIMFYSMLQMLRTRMAGQAPPLPLPINKFHGGDDEDDESLIEI